MSLRRGRKPSAGRTGSPNPVDVHVGGRVRLRRTLLGLSQEKLGEALGLTFQQVQKYERGANRIGASRMFDLSRVLDVPVSFFFDDMPQDVAMQSPRRRIGIAESPAEPFDDRKGVVSGKSVYVRLVLGGRRIIKKKRKKQPT